MTTAKRLAQLETTAPSQTGNKYLPQLVELAGLVDGLHWPFRQHGGRVAKLTAIVQQRRQYQRAGIVWNLADGSARGWKQAQRLRDALSADGLIGIHRDGELRVRLTPTGDRTARAALGLPTVNALLPRRLLDMLHELPEDRPAGWVSEFTLAGIDGDRQALAQVMLPMLSGGIIDSHSSTTGEIFYRPTGEPLAASPEDALQTPNYGQADQLIKVYDDAFNASLAGRERVEPSDSEIVIPLPASRP
jgi:hypothetical protein